MLKVLGHVGVLLSYIAGSYLNWRQSAIFVAVAPTMLFFGTLFIPETPSYLVLNGKDDEAASSLQWLRGAHVDIRHELQVTLPFHKNSSPYFYAKGFFYIFAKRRNLENLENPNLENPFSLVFSLITMHI